MTWNALDQLTQVSGTGITTTTFEYDPLGRRVELVQGSTTKTYFLDGLSVLSDGSSDFLHGAGLDELLQADDSSATRVHLADHLGSIGLLADTSGNVQSRYDYQSYGKLEGGLANPSTLTPYTYTGREDDGTGLMYYRARYYQPTLERFVSDDPMGDAQRYVDGNPLRFVDPLGLELVYPQPGGKISFSPKLISKEEGECEASCHAELWGFPVVGGASIAGGFPTLSAPGKVGGATPGTSPLSALLSRIFPTKLPFQVPTPSLFNPSASSNIVGRIAGRWLPWVGAATIIGEAAYCKVKCANEGCSKVEKSSQ